MGSKLTQDSENEGVVLVRGAIGYWVCPYFPPFTVLEYWLGWCFINNLVVFPHVSPKRQYAVSAMALYLIHRRGSIIIHGNTGAITCSEFLGTLVNARRNVRLFPSSKSLWCRWGNTNAFKSRTFNTSQRISLPFPKCLSNVCNVQTGWEPLRVWHLAVDKTWVLSLMTKGCWKWSVGKPTC